MALYQRDNVLILSIVDETREIPSIFNNKKYEKWKENSMNQKEKKERWKEN